MTPDEATRRLARRHTEKKIWPMTRNDPKAGPDGYIHYCADDHEPWPCLVHVALTTTDHPDVRAGLAVTELPQTGEAVLCLGVPYHGTEWTLEAIRAALSATSEPT
jgi:hypothetical protein